MIAGAEKQLDEINFIRSVLDSDNKSFFSSVVVSCHPRQFLPHPQTTQLDVSQGGNLPLILPVVVLSG